LPASKTEGPGHIDPLLASPPLPPTVTKKLGTDSDTPAMKTTVTTTAGAAAVTVPPAPPIPPAESAAMPSTVPAPAGDPLGGRRPVGVQSVLAASGGLDQPVCYVPVPTVVVPQAQPPQPPAPVPPQPTPPMYQNAFTPPAAGPQQLPSAGYGPGMQGMVPYAPGVPAQGMLPYPGGPMAPVMGVPPAGPFGARAYSGPQPPSPFGGPTPAVAGAGMDRQAMPVSYQAAAGGGPQGLQQMLATLHESLYPSQREWTACSLANLDWRAYPQILPALLNAARQDSAATVRAACAACLARMNTGDPQVLTTLQALRNDADMRVRQAATQALSRLAPAPSAIQPVRATNP
jgi:hypothetical protein